MQETVVRSLVQEDPTCFGVTKPVCHNCRICALEPVLGNKRNHHSEKPTHHNEEQTLLAAARENL